MLLDTASTPLSTRSYPETSPGGKAARRGTTAAATACPHWAPGPSVKEGRRLLLPTMGCFRLSRRQTSLPPTLMAMPLLQPHPHRSVRKRPRPANPSAILPQRLHLSALLLPV
ncbi:unnamed protein product [Rangifer tarandus platyrhynchus]|uniref:Uncharacterized protein n=1 Tax=Rangifer tarandus platyrhynchus TaxID=3082113 RepID=A0AC59ZZ51_RANTA